MTKSDKKFHEEYVPINGIQQYMLHIPNDSENVLIMLHGGPCMPNSYTAHYVAPYLNFCNVVYYDQRGCGKTQLKSKSKPQDLTMDALIEDLRQTISYLKERYQTKRIFIAGHSWGSVLGTEYIQRYPEDVLGYFAYGQCVATSVTDKIFYAHLKEKVLQSGNKGDMKKFHSVNKDFPNVPLSEFVRGTAVLAGLELKYGYQVADVKQIVRKSPIMSFRDGMQIMKTEFADKIVGDIFYSYDIRDITDYKTPVYYLLGRHDKWTDSDTAAKYFQTINAPKKGLYWIEKAGHMVDTDKPKDFFGTIKELMAGL